MKLVFEIDMDGSDFSLADAQLLISGSLSATTVSVEVGRPIDSDDGGQSQVARVFGLSSEYLRSELMAWQKEPKRDYIWDREPLPNLHKRIDRLHRLR